MQKLVISLLLFISYTSFSQTINQPPSCKVIPHVDTLHGQILVDNYAWLENQHNNEVYNYIKSENNYTDAVMKKTKHLQKLLYKEIVFRIKEIDVSVPYLLRGYWYYSKSEKGKNYPTYYRKKDTLNSKEDMILDINKTIRKNNWFDVFGRIVSPNNDIMAYYVDKIGNYDLDVFFKNLKANSHIYDTLHSVSSVVWANDNETVVYSKMDTVTKRSCKIYLHKLGQPKDQDKLIYYESDSMFEVDIKKSKSQDYIFISSVSADESEIWYIDANNPHNKLNVIQPREKGHLYAVENYDDDFYIISNKNAINFKLVKTQSSSPSIANWQQIIPNRENVVIESFELFKDYLVLLENHNATYKIRIINWISKEEYYIPFQEDACNVSVSGNPNFDTKILRYTYESMTTPYSIYEYNMQTQTKKLLKQEKINGYNESAYISQRVWATTKDSIKIPISLVYKRGVEKNKNNPLIIEGYGAYGISLMPDFSLERINLLERGFIYAIAHTRGGSELGPEWYLNGKLLFKKNTFSDFIDCINYLINEKYTSKGLIVAKGESAGGLLVGTVVNMIPELFKGAVLNVPFLDLINTMSNANLPLTTLEYEEWGNPSSKEYFDYMLSYSPYNNIVSQEYPHMLFTVGVLDEQVKYWEALKMVAKLRKIKTDTNKLLIKIELDSGHMGAPGRYNYYKEVAFEQAFILSLFDIK